MTMFNLEQILLLVGSGGTHVRKKRKERIRGGGV
jgi:hypothetical protein